VFLANDRGQAKVGEASEHLGSDIRTVFVVADVFGEQFFASVRSREARFNGYSRNGESPNLILLLSDGWGAFAQVTFVPRVRTSQCLVRRAIPFLRMQDPLKSNSC
jgi:hypothetical protein